MNDTLHGSSNSSNASNEMLLMEFMGRRGLEQVALDRVGARWSADSACLYFPRYGREEGDAVPPLEVVVVGWKVRDLARDQHFNHPSGISARHTWPLLVRDVLPASGLLICEGETDTMRMAQSSLPSRFSSDVMCIPGASSFCNEWLAFLRTYDRVVILPDGDDAGALLPETVAALLPGVRSVTMPSGHDVCSFLMEHTEDDLGMLIESAPLYMSRKKIYRKDWKWDDAGSNAHRSKLIRLVAQEVELRPAGPNEFKGKCPFHDDDTPSFFVNPDKGLYRCWGCDARGDVITWLKQTRDIDFKEAMSILEAM